MCEINEVTELTINPLPEWEAEEWWCIPREDGFS